MNAVQYRLNTSTWGYWNILWNNLRIQKYDDRHVLIRTQGVTVTHESDVSQYHFGLCRHSLSGTLPWSVMRSLAGPRRERHWGFPWGPPLWPFRRCNSNPLLAFPLINCPSPVYILCIQHLHNSLLAPHFPTFFYFSCIRLFFFAFQGYSCNLRFAVTSLTFLGPVPKDVLIGMLI